ncbi:hypothetical protein DL96DRAFT_207329 [Flagelloscypha sp. PMI_526]|nr:hypothetical protein DL96DRAFT_207329 [Flagelloscypha sp. PMI_526]
MSSRRSALVSQLPSLAYSTAKCTFFSLPTFFRQRFRFLLPAKDGQAPSFAKQKHGMVAAALLGISRTPTPMLSCTTQFFSRFCNTSPPDRVKSCASMRTLVKIKKERENLTLLPRPKSRDSHTLGLGPRTSHLQTSELMSPMKVLFPRWTIAHSLPFRKMNLSFRDRRPRCDQDAQHKVNSVTSSETPFAFSVTRFCCSYRTFMIIPY